MRMIRSSIQARNQGVVLSLGRLKSKRINPPLIRRTHELHPAPLDETPLVQFVSQAEQVRLVIPTSQSSYEERINMRLHRCNILNGIKIRYKGNCHPVVTRHALIARKYSAQLSEFAASQFDGSFCAYSLEIDCIVPRRVNDTEEAIRLLDQQRRLRIPVSCVAQHDHQYGEHNCRYARHKRQFAYLFSERQASSNQLTWCKTRL